MSLDFRTGYGRLHGGKIATPCLRRNSKLLTPLVKNFRRRFPLHSFIKWPTIARLLVFADSIEQELTTQMLKL